MSSLYENTNNNVIDNNTNNDKRVVLLPKKLNRSIGASEKVTTATANFTFKKQDPEKEKEEAFYASLCDEIYDSVEKGITRDSQINFWKKYGLTEEDYNADLENQYNLRMIEKYTEQMIDVPEELLEATRLYQEKMDQIITEDDTENQWWVDKEEEYRQAMGEPLSKEEEAAYFEDWLERQHEDEIEMQRENMMEQY